MATSRSYFASRNCRFLPGNQSNYTDSAAAALELEESDIYNSSIVGTRSNSPEFCKAVQSSRMSNKSVGTARRGDRADRASGRPGSLPVNIPDWSKILKDEYRENRRWDIDVGDDADGEDGLDGEVRVPPHELLARTRIASFSVQEGIGRTLKGRDLNRVRNAIWEKTGFQD